MHTSTPGLWHHHAFRLLWTGQTVSQFGSQISLVALPLTAALVLQATPLQMGVLTMAETLPFLLLSLVAGVWVDRVRRRPLLIGADLGRCALLGVIPLAAFWGILRIELLYAVAFMVGVLTTFFEIAYQSYLPTLINRANLVEGNSKLATSQAVAEITGPGLAGGLVQLLSAPLAITADALSFLCSGLLIGAIRTPESSPPAPTTPSRLRAELAAGLRSLLSHPILRALVGCSATLNFAYGAQGAILILYLSRDLELRPALIGTILAASNVGALAGAFIAGRVAHSFGLGHTLISSVALAILGIVLIPLAGQWALAAVPLLIIARCFGNLGSTVYTINGISLRQRLTPLPLLGRVNAGMRFVAGGAAPIGALLGGILGTALGLRPTLLVGGIVGILAVGWVWWSPLHHLRDDAPPAT